jgi:hypothetical protein
MNLRRWLAVAVVLVLFASPALAQRGGYGRPPTPPRPSTGGPTTRFEITPLIGLQWGGTIRTYEGDVVFEDSGMWGVIVPLFDAIVEYWQIGGLREIRRSGNVHVFGSLSLGATHIDPKTRDLSDEWKFSTIFGIGTKVFVSERVALRLQASMPLTFIYTSGGMWCGGGGCYTSIGGEGSVQGNLLAGLTFAF